MARPSTPLRAGWANKSSVMDIWNQTLPPRRRRLHALMLLWDARPGETRTRFSEMLGVSRRQLCRWVTAFNAGGLQQLLYPPRRPLGRRRIISVADYNEKIFSLVQAKEDQGIPWTVAEVQQELAEKLNIQVKGQTLRRYLARSGFEPVRAPRKPQRKTAWTLPWPEEYGCSLADYLKKSGRTVT